MPAPPDELLGDFRSPPPPSVLPSTGGDYGSSAGGAAGGAPSLPGTTPTHLAHFEIKKRLGSGGMAEVFLAEKRGAEGTSKVLVVKRILPSYGRSSRFRVMFLDEARLATSLNHPNVVQVYEFFDAGEQGHLLSMEYVEGPDLGTLLEGAKTKGVRLSPWVAAFIIAEAAKGLHYAHEKKDQTGTPLDIVHRDVSPQNVLLSFDGAVKIADFGIASAREVKEEEGVLKGKFRYMSPEQARGEKVDRRSDLYSLGVILWECLAGRPLHGGLGGEALLDIVRSGIVEPPSTYVRDIPAALEEITLRALSPWAPERFPTGRELAGAVARAALVAQELVDAARLESSIVELVRRDVTRPGGREPSQAESEADPDAISRPLEFRTQAAAPMALSAIEMAAPSLSPFGGGPGGNSVPIDLSEVNAALARAIPQGPREVRHVALVTLKLRGLDVEMSDRARAEVGRALERLRTMLGDMAYKREMRWSFHGDGEAQAVAGLGSKPAQAALDAVSLALETHEAIAGFRDDVPIEIGAAIGIVRGIASGTRDPEGNLVRFQIHDPASYLAEVVTGATPLHATWVAGGVYRLVRREFVWGDAPTLSLDERLRHKNLPPNMRIYALERSLSREERELAAGGSSDLVGRDAEKADLNAAFHEAVNASGGAGAMTVRAVTGELGIGKTALAATFVNELPPHARLVRVECSPSRMEVPFSSVADLVRDIVQATADEPFTDVAARIASVGGGAAQGDASNPMVARLAELATNRQLARGGDDDDAHYRKKLVVNGVRMLLAALALEQPLVLVIDGLQWADKASLELFGDLAKLRRDPLPILLVLVTRPDERVAAVLEGQVRIELRGLTPDEQVRLVENRFAVRSGAREVCAELVPRVGGNPFFLLEMIDALIERGAIEQKDDALVRPESGELRGRELPSTLDQLLSDRVRELPEAERGVVEWLAIAGGPLDIGDLSTLEPLADEETTMRLCARGICDRKGEALDFRHPLTRDVTYSLLGLNRRIAMHFTLGEHLAKTSLGRGLSAAIVARHLARGEAGPRAAHFYLEAANAARSSYQMTLAIRYFRRALAHLPDDDPRRLPALEALETIFRVLGRRRDRIDHLGELRRLAGRMGTARAACLALIRTARFDLDEGRLARGLPLAQSAAEVAKSSGQIPLEIEALALVSEFLRELGEVQGALAACDRALAACEAHGKAHVPQRVRADVLRSRGVLLRRVGRVSEAVDAYVEAVAVFRKTNSRRQEARAKDDLAFAMIVQGRYEDAVALALEAIQIDLSIGGRFQLAKTLTTIGYAYSFLGDGVRSLAYLRRAREAHERYGDQDTRTGTLLATAEAHLEAGDLASADSFLRDARALNAATANAYETTHAAVVAAALALASGDAPLATECALEARRAAEHQALTSFHFYGLALEASARATIGELHAATLLATTALGAVETLQGCEYGLEIRALSAEALEIAGSPQAPLARQRAIDHAVQLAEGIHELRLRRLFAQRPRVARLFARRPDESVAPLDADARASLA